MANAFEGTRDHLAVEVVERVLRSDTAATLPDRLAVRLAEAAAIRMAGIAWWKSRGYDMSEFKGVQRAIDE